MTTAHDADIHHTTYHIHPVEVINELGHFCWQYVTAFLIRTSRSLSPTVNYFWPWHMGIMSTFFSNIS